MPLRISGNRSLNTLPGQTTRPTVARVREAIFNIWQGDIEGCAWLDLCAGIGSMGAEALYRGASIVVGIEHSTKACQIIKQNWQTLASSDQTIQVIRAPVLQALPKLEGQQFDRIYFDPPYASNLYEPVLAAIVTYNLLTIDGELAAEHSPKRDMKAPAGLLVDRQKTYGNTAVTFYRWVYNHN